MSKRTLLGMLTPSSNTILEPITSAMLRDVPQASAHFSRFRVRKIALSDDALQQFDLAPILAAADLLADAKVQVIAWNGTSAGWLGFDADRELCRVITEQTGVQAATSVLALNELITLYGARRVGLVTPYLHDVQARIVDNYQRAGFDVVAERHLNDPGNFSFSEIGTDTIKQLVREVAASKPDVITTFCTNLNAAPLVAALEEELDIPILDTVSVVVWKSLKLTGVDVSQIQGWGRLFQDH